MKDILQALDRALERGEVRPVRSVDIVAALERVAPGVVRKQVSLPAPRLPRIVGPKAERSPAVAPKVAPVQVTLRGRNPTKVVLDEVAERPLRGDELRDAIAALHAVEPAREPWPESWFTHTDSGDGHRCLQMWAECLRICLVDACGEACKTFEAQAKWDEMPEKMRKGPRPLPRNAWVGTSDFMQVCALAGLDGQAVLDQVAPKLTQLNTAAELGIALSGAARRGFANVRSSFGGGEAAA